MHAQAARHEDPATLTGLAWLPYIHGSVETTDSRARRRPGAPLRAFVLSEDLCR
jgi:hypothetical protein